MLWRALKHYNLPLQILKSEDIANGVLARQKPAALLVPGGWAKRKAKSLGRAGRAAIQEYVSQGGTYIGFCGGAGLALTTPKTGPSLELCPWDRKPFDQRLPNCSGYIYLHLQTDDNLLNNYPQSEMLAPIWWPSQFKATAHSDVKILATYSSPGSDFWVADLPLEQSVLEGLHLWEDHYGINLHPDYLAQDPCIIQGKFGQGNYLLSYTHLETPDSKEANILLAYILKNLAPLEINLQTPSPVSAWNLKRVPQSQSHPELLQAKSCLEDIIQIGLQNGQLSWRKEWLLGWKRGIPGFALNTLYALVSQSLSLAPSSESIFYWQKEQKNFLEKIYRFRAGFIDYLNSEAQLENKKPSSPVSSSCSDLQEIRLNLVGPFPGQGGLFGEMVLFMQELLYTQILKI
jgi:hypothetical protein